MALVHSRDESADDIVNFLSSLDPPMTYLAERFIKAGLTSNEYLAALAKMTDDTLKVFLAEELGLTTFDRFAITLRLKSRFR